MIYRRLGRTGLKISALGFGASGSLFNNQQGDVPQSEVNAFVRHALDLGINYFDVSPSLLKVHGDAEITLGRALAEVPRDKFLISGKAPLVDPTDGHHLPVKGVIDSLDRTLKRLAVDYLDVFYVGGHILSGAYGPVLEELLPLLQRARQQGKFRFLGGGEKSSTDGDHEWLQYGLKRDLFDVVMVAFNLINQSAELTVFPLCQKQDVGVITIFTVRKVFGNPARLQEVIAELKRDGSVDRDAVSDDDPMGWLTQGTNETLVTAAYKFGAGHPAVHSVMTGTQKASHLDDNAMAIGGPYLPLEKLARLRKVFGRVTQVVGN
jgi:L-galactose dehydrogenase